MKPPSDKQQARRVAVMLAVAGVAVMGLALWAAVLLMPAVSGFVATQFAPGLGLKTAAIIAAGLSFALLVALTLVAGDGLLGEIQFVIPGFFLFFLFFWLMTAWVF